MTFAGGGSPSTQIETPPPPFFVVVFTTLVACFQPPFTLIRTGSNCNRRSGTATIPVRNRYHTSSIASEEVETSFLVVKKGSMDGSVMSDVIDGENTVEIFRDTSKSSQNLFDNEHWFFLVVKCARRCTIHIRQTVHKNLHSAHKNDPSLPHCRWLDPLVRSYKTGGPALCGVVGGR